MASRRIEQAAGGDPPRRRPARADMGGRRGAKTRFVVTEVMDAQRAPTLAGRRGAPAPNALRYRRCRIETRNG